VSHRGGKATRSGAEVRRRGRPPPPTGARSRCSRALGTVPVRRRRAPRREPTSCPPQRFRLTSRRAILPEKIPTRCRFCHPACRVYPPGGSSCSLASAALALVARIHMGYRHCRRRSHRSHKWVFPPAFGDMARSGHVCSGERLYAARRGALYHTRGCGPCEHAHADRTALPSDQSGVPMGTMKLLSGRLLPVLLLAGCTAHLRDGLDLPDSNEPPGDTGDAPADTGGPPERLAPIKRHVCADTHRRDARTTDARDVVAA
jgi:hypothetical protein